MLQYEVMTEMKRQNKATTSECRGIVDNVEKHETESVVSVYAMVFINHSPHAHPSSYKTSLVSIHFHPDLVLFFQAEAPAATVAVGPELRLAMPTAIRSTTSGLHTGTQALRGECTHRTELP